MSKDSMSQPTFGTLYLLPTLLGETSTVDKVLPAQVQAQARLLRHFKMPRVPALS